jgi:hypothetical protein
MNYKSPNRDWYNEIEKNNPIGDMPEFNELGDYTIFWINNPIGEFQKNNEADRNHPLWFDWFLIGARF